MLDRTWEVSVSWKVSVRWFVVSLGSSVLVPQSVVDVAVHARMEVVSGSNHQLLVIGQVSMIACFLPLVKAWKQQRLVRQWPCSCISWSVLLPSQLMSMNVVSKLCYG